MAGAAALTAVLTKVDDLADGLAKRAGGVDRGEVDCRESYQMVRDGGLLDVLVPASAGGHGLSFLEVTKALERLGATDVSTALGLNMHNVAIGALCETADRPVAGAGLRFREWLFAEVHAGGRMFASATSEVGTGARLRGLRTVYERTDGGFVINGHKSFVSLAGVADYFVVTARDAGADDDEISHFVVAADDPGVRFGQFWAGSALAGTSTAEMFLDHVEIPRDRLFMGVEGMSLFKLVREPHWMVSGYTGAYLGLAGALFDRLTETVAKDPARAGSAVVRHEIGRLATALRAARALVYAACAEVDRERGGIEANTGVHAAKYTVGELLNTLAAAALRLAGSKALAVGSDLERLLRESRFCAVMPAKPDDCLEYVGKAHLGTNMHDVRSFTW
jgi:alkylation response protein AidB-like acyl-CoA dehydrogenase